MRCYPRLKHNNRELRCASELEMDADEVDRRGMDYVRAVVGDRLEVPENPDLSSLSTTQLRQLMAIRGVSAKGCFEKADLVQCLYDDYVQSELEIGPSPSTPTHDYQCGPGCTKCRAKVSASDHQLVMQFTEMAQSGRAPSARFQCWLRAESRDMMIRISQIPSEVERQAQSRAALHQVCSR
eukprot:TRINITY_DN2111_c2_g1_i1.p1 TRINITY_DN2111_c2_g1~~TRINITY_DN2111_c2_g1_i1.p1  ORF type:complete len:182 (+),score=5.37 TRINITY_DN2111_c2_g1_i1:206-751(+)